MNHLKQQGFTLLELLIALALGLVIIAAAVTLFITGQRSYSVQQGMTENQNNANFGLNLIAKDVRLTNLDGGVGALTDRTKSSGIVLTSSANFYTDTTDGNKKLANLPLSINAAKAPLTLLSRSAGQPGWEAPSNVLLAGGDGLQSDQLVIQYLPVNRSSIVSDNVDDQDFGFDCEGNKIESNEHYVIQRYFLRVDTNAAANEPNQPLALACDAGRYLSTDEADEPKEFINYGDAGQIIMQRADHFRVLFGIEEGTGNALRRRFVDAKTYFDYPSNALKVRPRIVSLQLSVLSRSMQPVGDDNVINADQKYLILDQEVQVKPPAANSPKYVRQVLTHTIALRNGHRR